MVGFWEKLFQSEREESTQTSINLETQTFKLKRGDFCLLISRVGNLKRGTEVMVSSVYRDRRHCRVVDYGRRYHKVHEVLLDKI